MAVDPFSMVTTIVVVSVVGGTINTALKHRSAAPPPPPRDNGEQQAMQRELADLRQRVATLESIVTEPSFELKRQIESLEPRARRVA